MRLPLAPRASAQSRYAKTSLANFEEAASYHTCVSYECQFNKIKIRSVV